MGPSTRHHPLPHLTNVTIGQREEIISRSAAKVGPTVLGSSVTVTRVPPRLSSFSAVGSENIDGQRSGSVIDTHEPLGSVPARILLVRWESALGFV
jgi:hypothetical protein